MVFATSLMAVGARDGGAARKRPGGKSLRSRIRAAGYTAVKPDTGIRQRRLRAAANSTADQRVNLQRTQNARQSAVAAAVGVHDFGRDDFTVFHIVELELLRVAKMLKNRSVIVSNCNSRCMFSFRVPVQQMKQPFAAKPARATWAASAAEAIVAAFNPQRQALHQYLRQLFRARVYIC